MPSIVRCIYETNIINLDDNCAEVVSGSCANGIITLVLASGAFVNIDINPCLIATAGTTSVVTQVVTAGNEISSHDDGAGTIVAILESITTVIDNANGTYTFTNEAGTTVTIQTRFGFTDVIAAATSLVDITHGKNSVPIIWQMVDTVTGQVVVPDSVIFIDNATVRFGFNPILVNPVTVNIL